MAPLAAKDRCARRGMLQLSPWCSANGAGWVMQLWRAESPAARVKRYPIGIGELLRADGVVLESPESPRWATLPSSSPIAYRVVFSEYNARRVGMLSWPRRGGHWVDPVPPSVAPRWVEDSICTDAMSCKSGCIYDSFPIPAIGPGLECTAAGVALSADGALIVISVHPHATKDDPAGLHGIITFDAETKTVLKCIPFQAKRVNFQAGSVSWSTANLNPGCWPSQDSTVAILWRWIWRPP